jgi:prepilin-type N-terminal cleavage/methylation domain-containing protein
LIEGIFNDNHKRESAFTGAAMKKPLNTAGLSASKRNRGFSLVELVVIITVIAILSGVVSLSIGNIDRDSRVTLAAGRALSSLRYAQEMAMTTRQAVNFTVSGNTYSATYRVSGLPVPSPTDKTQPLTVTLNTGDASGVVISSGLNGTISFDIDGKPWATDGITELASQTSIMNLNAKQNLVLFNSGYSVINPVSGACGGCGGC